jgi:hypothetical protein
MFHSNFILHETPAKEKAAAAVKISFVGWFLPLASGRIFG